MAENPRYQTATACAGEALDALYSTYWADSFNADLLEARLAETIYFFTRNARRLTEATDDSAAAESVLAEPSWPEVAPSASFSGRQAGGNQDVI